MRTSTSGLSHVKFFDSLEPRRYMANPVVVDFAVDSTAAYAGKEITLTAHVSDDLGVAAVVFWIEDNQDALDQFILNSFDQPLGDVFTHDAGVPGQYSLRVRVGASWKASTKFGVDVVDTDGNYSGAPINFVTVDTRPKPFVTSMRAETLDNGDIHLIAFASSDGGNGNGGGGTGTVIGGVTFFLDQNGNNQWDVGTDIDLGLGTRIFGQYELTVTPQIGWNTTWFTASAFDTRASSDRFGPNRSTVLRGDDDDVPWISGVQIFPPDNDLNSQVWQSNETVRLIVGYSAYRYVRSVSIFHDRNQNGLWDVGIDTPLVQYYPPTPLMSTWYFEPQLFLGELGHGWQSLGFAARDNSGRGDDSWSAVKALWLNIDNTPWIESGSINPSPVPQGTATIDLTFRVFDDDGVMGVRQSFVDVNGNGGFAETGESQGTNLVYLTPGRTGATWQLTFYVGNLAPGTYAVNLWLQDYREVWGPRTRVTFTVV